MSLYQSALSDPSFTVGFGRPETEGFDESAIDTSLLLSVLHSSNNSNNFALLCSPESAACIAAYVELANIAKQYSRFVNVLLKEAPSTFLSEMRNISGRLDAFSSRWLWARGYNVLRSATDPARITTVCQTWPLWKAHQDALQPYTPVFALCST